MGDAADFRFRSFNEGGGVVKIETGNPTQSGRYACYRPGVKVPTVLQLWVVGTGWLTLLSEPPTAGKIAGWVGPLPVFEGNGVETKPAPLEFDL